MLPTEYVGVRTVKKEQLLQSLQEVRLVQTNASAVESIRVSQHVETSLLQHIVRGVRKTGWGRSSVNASIQLNQGPRYLTKQGCSCRAAQGTVPSGVHRRGPSRARSTGSVVNRLPPEVQQLEGVDSSDRSRAPVASSQAPLPKFRSRYAAATVIAQRIGGASIKPVCLTRSRKLCIVSPSPADWHAFMPTVEYDPCRSECGPAPAQNPIRRCSGARPAASARVAATCHSACTGSTHPLVKLDTHLNSALQLDTMLRGDCRHTPIMMTWVCMICRAVNAMGPTAEVEFCLIVSIQGYIHSECCQQIVQAM